MSTNFLQLPREIRDQIYEYALYPTGSLTVKFSSSKSIILQPNVQHDEVVVSVGRPINPLIVLASRQIYAETSRLLWAHNEFYFPNSKRLVDGVRRLGQVSSRRLVRVRLMVQFEREARKALAMLASRGRKGDLKCLTLYIPSFDQRAHAMNPANRSQRYEDFLAALREMCAGGKSFEKVIEVNSFFVCRSPDADCRSSGLKQRHRVLGEQALYELHCAWAGKLVCNGTLLFENYEWADGRKGRLPRIIAEHHPEQSTTIATQPDQPSYTIAEHPENSSTR